MVEELRALLAQRDTQLAALTAALAEQTVAVTALTKANTELIARIGRLEHLLTRNSGNSSMPPSRDNDPGKTPPPAKTEPGQGQAKRKKGKQSGAGGASLAWRADPTRTEPLFPSGACDCGRDLGEAADLGVFDRYQQHEIPPVTVTVTQYDAHRVRCRCGRRHTAPRPAGARSGPVGYGPNLQAFVVYLMVAQHLPAHRCVALLAALTGTSPSVGFVHGMLARTAGLLGPADAQARRLLAVAPVICADETPIRAGSATPRPGRKKADKYLHVACTDRLTHYTLGDRDLDTFKKTVVADAAGVVVHDRYAAYDSTELGVTAHQLCASHLLRDLESAGQTYPEAEWPPQCARALRALIHQANLARSAGAGRVDDAVAAPLLAEFVGGVAVGLSETVRHGDRPGEAKAAALLRDLRDRHDDVFRFVTDLRVPATNNQAERDARPAKIQQNISGRLTSEERTKDRYLIRGVLSTAVKHGVDVIGVLRDAFVGVVWMPPDPLPS